MFKRTIAGLALALAFSALTGCSLEANQEDPSETVSDALGAAAPHFETFRGADGQFYFSLVAANGANVLRSEGYTREASAKAGIAAVITAAKDPSAFDVQDAASGESYFNLVAKNGEIVGTSELYASRSNATRGAKTVTKLLQIIVGEPAVEPARRAERFETFVGVDGQRYFRVRAGNGAIVLASEGYTSKAGLEGGIASVRAHGVDPTRFEIEETETGAWLRLRAANGEIVARGEAYASRANAERAIGSLTSLLGRALPVTEAPTAAAAAAEATEAAAAN